MATGVGLGTSIPQNSFHDALDSLGITKDLAQKRIEIYRNVAVNSSIFCKRYSGENIEVIIAGSRGEGTAANAVDSDVDALFVQRSVICFQTFPGANEENHCIVTFLLDFENMKSGYAMLRLISTGDTRTEERLLRNIRDGLVQNNGHGYLRNDRNFISAVDNRREGITRQQFVFDDTTGPAKRIMCGVPFLEGLFIDRVLAFPVSYPSVLDSWCRRERKCNWPSKELIEKASCSDVFVVPVGVPGSAEELIQWRVSVTLAEQALVHSFNDTQIKLFAAVKMIAKNELKPVCDNMSSYVVKNVMFWVIEQTEAEYFTREFFDERLLSILKYLKRCVYWKYLPNYMFPSRNMLDNKILLRERRELIHRLDDMIDNGCFRALLWYPLLKDMIYMPLENFQKKVIFSKLIEQVAIAVFSIQPYHFKKLMKDRVIHRKLFHLKLDSIAQTVCKHVFPIIRRTNPYGYFDLLSIMADEEIFCRLREGVSLGFLKS